MTDVVIHETKNDVVILTLNRPEKLNALSYALIDRLMALLDQVEQNDAARAVILTGAGDRAFSAGGDIPEFASSVREGVAPAMRDFVHRGQCLTARIETFPKPVIVAVNGLAYGGGCEIVEAAHLSVAVSDAQFAKPEIKLGMPPTFGGTQRLPRLAGRKRALNYLLAGDPFSATEARQIGLINSIVPRGELIPAALGMAQRIVRHSPLAVAGILSAVNQGLDLTVSEGLKVEAEQFAALVPSRDLREGLDAFIEKRPAHFMGR